jgi:hypothetical protein
VDIKVEHRDVSYLNNKQTPLYPHHINEEEAEVAREEQDEESDGKWVKT